MSPAPPALIPHWIRERFPPDRRSAVDFLRGLINKGMLQEIAAADYGQDVDRHLAALRPVRQGGELTELDHWYPMEVLELIRWSEPEEPRWKPGSPGVRGHRMRAFSCAVLLATPNFEPEKETLIQLLDSVDQLGEKAQEATARFLAWQLGTLDREQDRPFFALALAALAQSLEDPLSSPQEQDLAEWVAAEEAGERAWLAEFNKRYHAAPWLFGLSFSDMRNKRWEALIRRMQKQSGDGPLGRLLSAGASF